MKKQKVLFDAHLIANGGTEAVLQSLAVFLQQRDGGKRYDVTVSAILKNRKDFYAVFPEGIRFVQREKIKKGINGSR